MEGNKEEEQQQEIWSWGAGTDGQLGTGKLQDEHTPQLLHSLSSFGPISFLSCGGAHVIALTPGGRVLSWGRGASGQLGHGEMVNGLQPKVVQALEGFAITHVSAGWNHSGFVSETGCLFTCGDGSFGQLGHGDCDSRCSPEKVAYFDSYKVEQIACGMRHSLVLVKGGQVYGFGSGKRGQLGISVDRVRSLSLPQATIGLDNIKIMSVYANGDHSAALCAAGEVHVWGRGFSGSNDVYIPQLVTPHYFRQAALGWNHILLLAADGEVFMLGGYGHGILNGAQMAAQMEQMCEKPDEGGLQKFHGLTGKKILQIAAGAEHSALIIDDGSVMTWGWGEHGQLGLGDTTNQTGPHAVCFNRTFNPQHLVPRVFCGSGFTYVVGMPADSKT
ncbi:OLC1v1028064C1 [Oldenlandia corymbosa var. corymbosa]|uniref:OLC1v1028064C1 n=1 Tax=Oldenlandia corymbosa var. corymbosa TaxID=529605 RepID=A0AAV1CDJ9_OLDCO|nr:OLC1v1028064C1 [Oldenlandia corymbosa var. corymbosa]